MKCLVTGIETNNKWNNLAISKEALLAARKVANENSSLTMRQALVKVSKAYIQELKSRKPAS